jgi:hypothetical protein
MKKLLLALAFIGVIFSNVHARGGGGAAVGGMFGGMMGGVMASAMTRPSQPAAATTTVTWRDLDNLKELVRNDLLRLQDRIDSLSRRIDKLEDRLSSQR